MRLDASLELWRRHGEMCAMVTSLGLHRDVDPVPYRVSFRAEVRRETYSRIVSCLSLEAHKAHLFTPPKVIIDKVISTFTGRPPMLSYRYSSTPLPLDISDGKNISFRPQTFDLAVPSI